ncbi:hypothetical protein ATO12_15605 [Aquimarina atlantica]|uniref:HTH araC/xylS-type domain-containing protein n=1 Tax=Aquimarina atlantica TaxID=1317122 RepID=A0A023BWC8_9FLAO|nr:helix-turn-helix domain-containing protein [Aquimarina atlantica]EZH74290.1 hypothetical protein ATO12_15605 [Aquimarina atlantica]
MYKVINFIISFGTLQGLIIGVLLLIKGFKSKQEKLYLALILIGFAAILGRVLIISIYNNQVLFLVNLNFILLVSPAFYLYTKECSNTTENIKFKSKHFLPFLIVNLGYLLFYFTVKDAANYQKYLQNTIKINESFSIIYFSIYLYLTYNLYKQNNSYYSKILYRLVNQLIFMFFGFFIIWIAYVLVEWMYFDYNMELVYYYPIMVLLAVILYYLSLQVIIRTQFLFDNKETPKRKTFILEEIESKHLLDKLTLFMNEKKPFLDGDISLITLANSLDVNPKVLSFVINEHSNKNFNDYINNWRVEEVKKRLNDKAYNHYKMLSIAFDCGFNSKSTFNLAFKKATGLSPSQYKKL